MASSVSEEPLNDSPGQPLSHILIILNWPDPKGTKKNRPGFCGLPLSLPVGHEREFAVPFYNILWARLHDSLLIIDYAHPAKTRIRPERLVCPLGNISNEEAEAWVEALLSRAYGRAQRRKRAKVLVNPHAGPGKALKIWEKEVRPLFVAANMQLDTALTTHSGEAIEICRNLDINAYDVVIPCSGDGLPHEVFNGLGKRPDALRALRTLAVAHIPCGSGNAMSCNLNGSYKPAEAALAVIKGVRTPLDLMSVTQGGAGKDSETRRTLSFLSQSVGIIAESDLGTENMRWMGAMRFNVGVVQRMLRGQIYPCTVAAKVEIGDKAGVTAHYRREREAETKNNTNVPTEGERSEAQDGGAGSPDALDAGEGSSAGEGLPPLRYGTVNDKVPDDWVVLPTERMGNFYCGNMAYMAPDTNFFPATNPHDGMMDLVMNDGDIHLSKYLGLMTSIENERFFEQPLVSYRKISAYRLTPRDQADGCISIDGERIPFEPFQVEIHPALGTVLSKNGRYEANGPPGWDATPQGQHHTD
ncbi:hypothetical protein DL764_007488 [Monosporascus ibericus]|uniref:DAGKc domain-containing protein n=1 Tax=Monosporascus ibericus TaxID=155417 RepID=A0A4Q4T0E4_9PEZI|nr:hypothetical protein DL764_007488 [Monosporascus ibericus]